MKAQKMLVAIIMVLNVGIYNELNAQTNVSGNITTNTTWSAINSPYTLIGYVYINSGATLTIESGVTIVMQNNSLEVGNNSSSILQANGVTFSNGTIYFGNSSGGTITNSTFVNTNVNFSGTSSPTVTNNNFDQNSSVYLHSQGVIPKMSGNSFGSQKIYLSTTFTTNTTLTNYAGCSYYLDNYVYINSGATLTIESGVTIVMQNNSLEVGNNSSSILQANGVTFSNGTIYFGNSSTGSINNSDINSVNINCTGNSSINIYQSNLDFLCVVANTSSNTITAANNYWGDATGPYHATLNPSGQGSKLSGSINFLPYLTSPISNAYSDLFTQNLKASPISGAAGSSDTVSFMIKNQGINNSDTSTTHIRITTSNSLVTTSDPLLASLNTPSITAGATYIMNQPVTIPSNLNAGTYYVWVILDVNNTAGQGSINEGNDKSCVTFTVTATQTSTLPLGIDVSEFQGTIDWRQVKMSGGKAFSFIRASAGSKTADSQFLNNIIAAKDSGLIVGAYHFAYPQYYTADSEAQKFLSVARSFIGSGYLPPVLDIEDSKTEASYPYLMGNDSLTKWINDWCFEVEKVAGVKPIVYATRYYARNYFEGDIGQYPYWVVTNSKVANSDPGDMGIWSSWMFQQYEYGDSGGTCAGITGAVDLDSFNGSIDSLRNLTSRTPMVVAGSVASLPTQSSLMQNYPNPFNPSTHISYNVASLGMISLKVYDLLGREVETLVNEVKAQGSYAATFNATNRPSGVYFCRLQAGTYSSTKKLILLK